MVFGILRDIGKVAEAVTDAVTDVASDVAEVATLGLVEKEQAETLLKAGYAVAEVAAMTNLSIDVISGLADDNLEPEQS